MSIINELNNEKTWQNFLKYKTKNKLLTKGEEEYFKKYIEQKKYTNIANQIINGEYSFSPPTKHFINKIGKEKKKVVYNYKKDETMILKFISYLISEKYNFCFAPNCYSFRKDYGVKQAIEYLTSVNHIEKLCCYKTSIEDYFNSIPVELLLPKLKVILEDDESLYEFIEKILTDKRIKFGNKILIEEKGVMAGIPIATFLANVYLKDLDQKYYKQKVIYARYSEDIIIFCRENELQERMIDIEREIYKHQLKLDDKKRELIAQGEMWSFLGFSYQNGVVDLSEITKKKIEAQIKRFARKIRKWMVAKNVSSDQAIKTMNRKFNRKFYELENGKDSTWCGWFFPVVNTTHGLKEIDLYMQEYLRYVVTGKHNKSNYKYVRYTYLKQCNYKSLVLEYWKKHRIMR